MRITFTDDFIISIYNIENPHEIYKVLSYINTENEIILKVQFSLEEHDIEICDDNLDYLDNADVDISAIFEIKLNKYTVLTYMYDFGKEYILNANEIVMTEFNLNDYKSNKVSKIDIEKYFKSYLTNFVQNIKYYEDLKIMFSKN